MKIIPIYNSENILVNHVINTVSHGSVGNYLNTYCLF
jgi:hypothetical protein